ncbi:MAG: homocysteine S-methyltransferase family protein [Chitinophagales bacterium]|nr:homocysteine S-methyltransferase family protein [Chitinophagales bacterium]MDW8393089.1 homocysteine S-methyltransferase family protein [Chitinophagales bacterium]
MLPDPLLLLPELTDLLRQRIVLLDGAMGTMIQREQLDEKDFRGKSFADHPHALKGCNDLLCLTQPQVIKKIHQQYLKAGADIIETNTFNANAISMQDYGLESMAYEINVAAAQLARSALTDIGTDTPRFVAGAIGPTNKMASLAPSVHDLGARAVTFQELENAYREQIRGLMDGGVDLLLIETIFDTLNAKAAIYAALTLFEQRGTYLPIILSATIADQSGRTLSGQTPAAFLYSVEHARPLAVGLNCALGASQLFPYLRELSERADCLVSCYPNAGLPNQLGQYEQTPEQMAAELSAMAAEGLLNLAGGCCGTTPEHIRQLAEALRGFPPRSCSQMPAA